MSNLNTIDYFKYINHPFAQLINAIFQGNPVIDAIPTISQGINDNRQVEYAIIDELPELQRRAVAGSYSDQKTTKAKYVVGQLIPGGNQWLDDRYFDTPAGNRLKEQSRQQFLQGIGASVNNELVNGTKTKTSWLGIDGIAIANGNVSTNTTAITDGDTAWAAYEQIGQLIFDLENVSVALGGYDTFVFLRQMQRFLGALNVEVTSNEVGMDIAKMRFVGGKVLNIVWAGKKINRSGEVIGDATGTNAYLYPIDVSETGLGYAFDGNFDVDQIKQANGMLNVIEFYDLLVSRTERSCGKYIQAL